MAKFIQKLFSKKNIHKLTTDQGNLTYCEKDYDDQYKLPQVAAKLSGIRINCNDSKYMRLLCVSYYWMAFTLCLMGTSNMTITFLKSRKFEDLVVVMPCVGFVAVGSSKSYKIVRNTAVFERIIFELKEMWPTGEMSEDKQKIARKMMKQMNIVVKGYFWCNMGLIFFYNFPPYFQIIKRMFGIDAPLVLAFKYVLPFDEYQLKAYPFILLIQTNACMSIVFFMLSSDLLFFIFLSNITLQFDFLSLRIRQMIYVPTDDQLISDFPLGKYSEAIRKNEPQLDSLTAEEWERKHMNELRDIVIRHQSLIRISGEVENMFNFSMLVNFMNSSIIICFCGICIVYLEEWNELKFKIFLLSSMTQIWLLCWYGQSLLDSSKEVAIALYESGWYNVSKRIKSLILIMLHRSQHEVFVTTYGFSIISLESYTTIIKTSWSYFTLLINTYNP
ncbi:odorant receptor 85b-like [Zerene cesonia]|uniref:odorant receptor 85b-like n=1 Tax=Zerene cesonia TaxID=33412 RepID=UPI0018E5A8E0|nr:odorant receptor 85b-like [Zerene cesonia]